MRAQELFTESKKIKRRLDTNVANTAKFSLIIGENALKIEKKINPRERFLCTGRSNNPNFGFLVSSYDT